MKTETMYRILVAVVMMLLLVVGIYIGVEISSKESKEKILAPVSTPNVSVKPYVEEKEVVSEDDVIADVSIIYTDVYPDCGHTIEQEELHENTTANRMKKEIDEKDLGYKLIGTKDGILIYQKVNVGKCRNHYKVVLENELVKIYRIGVSGEYELYQETEITINSIREGIKNRLIEGIEVDELEELILLIEDIES